MTDGTGDQQASASTTPEPRPGSTKFQGPTKTVLNRTWLIKVVVMTIVLIGFGSWGLYDAIAAYPARGKAYAQYSLFQYLQAAAEADEKEERGVLRREASVENPAQELEELRANRDAIARDAATESSGRYFRAQMELARLDWLTALSRVDMLQAENTVFEFPRQVLDELRTEWNARNPPSPLAFYDIPSQWIIMVICYAFSIHLILLFFRVSSKSYRWDPAEKRLTFPGGASIVPADLEEVDKRKWDKFIVFLKIKPDHPNLAGEAIKVDTYRYALLEDWILEMESIAFGHEDDEQAEDAPDEADDREHAGSEPSSADADEPRPA